MLPQRQRVEELQSQEESCEKGNFNKNYNELLAGVNRIRYLKKKQMHNHHIMTGHFANLLNRFYIQKEKTQLPSKPKFQLPKSQSVPFNGHTRFKYIFSEESPYKPKNGKILPLPRNISCRRLDNVMKKKEDGDKQNSESSNLFENKLSNETMVNFSGFGVDQSKPESKHEKMRVILQKRQQNYQEMRRTREKLEQKRRLNKQQLINMARENKQRVEMSRQEGRKKIEDHYFKYLDVVKANKQEERIKKARLSQKKYLEMMELQKQEQQELAIFQNSLVMEEELKSFLEQSSGQYLLGKDAKITEDTTLI